MNIEHRYFWRELKKIIAVQTKCDWLMINGQPDFCLKCNCDISLCKTYNKEN